MHFSIDFKIFLLDQLSNYWPFMSSLSDITGGANLTGGSGYMFTNDRFNQPNSAIYFNKTRTAVTTLNYVFYDTDFTLIMWIKFLSNQTFNSVVIFDSLNSVDKLTLYLDSTGTHLQSRMFCNGIEKYMYAGAIPIGTWVHITFVYKALASYIYVNGQKKYWGQLLNPRNTLRNMRLGPSDTIVDEIKLYTGAFSDLDVLNDYTLNSPCKLQIKIIQIIY